MDSNLHKCKHCGDEIEWEGFSDRTMGVIYCCDKCNEYFCTACASVHSNDEYILCNDCWEKYPDLAQINRLNREKDVVYYG